MVTLDGSRTSRAVLSEVERLGPGTVVTLVTVGGNPRATGEAPRAPYTGGAPVPGGIVRVPEARTVETKTQAYERARDQLTNYLEACAVPLRAAGLDVSIMVRFGETVEEILAAARECDPEVIMMATHGHSALAQAIFGSVAGRVVGSGVRPVLLVRPRELRAEAESLSGAAMA
jgi:nucleotide-binding universal stress UspA family protein